MKLLAKLSFLLFLPVFIQAENLIVGYYPDWGKWNTPVYTWKEVPYEKLTHVLWSFISPDSLGNLRGNAIDDPADLDSMVALAHKVNTKVIISLGGAGSCEYFASVRKDQNLRANFVHNLMNFIKDHNLDGVDMDWEYSSVPVASEDTIAYNRLLSDIRDSLPQEKTLSAAIPCSDYYGKYFNIDAMKDKLDWFGFMTYDITGYWDELARYNSPLYPNGNRTTWSWKETAEYWGNRGVPAEKMVFGIPFFGFEFDAATGPASTFNGNATYLEYKNICCRTDQEYFFDSVALVPYAVSSGSYTTFDDPKSASLKTQWVKDNQYAGVMIWELSQDIMEDGSQPMLSAIYETMQGNYNLIPFRKAPQNSGFIFADGILNFAKENQNFKNISVSVRDASGREILMRSMKSGESLDLSILTAGQYFVIFPLGTLKIQIH